VVADGLHQVCFAQAHPSVNEERVVYLGGFFGHSPGRRMGEQVAWTDNEVLEAVLGIEVGIGVTHEDTKRSAQRVATVLNKESTKLSTSFGLSLKALL
jgi:hypothetical protein